MTPRLRAYSRDSAATADSGTHIPHSTGDAAYEKRSIALSSNLHPAGFDELMPK